MVSEERRVETPVYHVPVKNRINRAFSTLQAGTHEGFALVALLAFGLGVAILHALLLLLLRGARLGVLQALAHELLALVALLALGLGIAALHPLLLLLLGSGRLLLVLRIGRQGQQAKRHQGDQRFHLSSSSFSMAATSLASSGATRVSKLCTRLPLRSTRYLWKFHFGAWPVALARSTYSGFLLRSVFANIGKSMAYWLTQNCEISLLEPGSWPPKSFIGKPSTTRPRARYFL